MKWKLKSLLKNSKPYFFKLFVRWSVYCLITIRAIKRLKKDWPVYATMFAIVAGSFFYLGCLYCRHGATPQPHVAPPVTPKKHVAETEKPKKQYPVSNWKPKPVGKEFNQIRWAGVGFQTVAENECNKCEQACWTVKGDRGETTCVGFSLRANPDLYVDILNTEWLSCKDKGLIMPDKNHPYGRGKDICYHFRKAYWERYVSKYKNCDWFALMHLSDTAILSGPRSAALILQRASGLFPDGLWGEKTEAQCQRQTWEKNKEKFITERLTYLAGLKDSEMFLQGWRARVLRMKARF